MARYDFWTHGVNTIVEYPDQTQLIRHTGWGTLIRQSADTNNWFHIAIPSPTFLEDDGSVFLQYIRLRAEVNENARIDLIHLRVDGTLIYSENVMLTDQIVDRQFDNPNRELQGGLVVAVHVQFLTGSPTGQIIFRGAGARFQQ